MTDRPVRVLYAEDDPGIARLVQKRLMRDGFLVEIATNGAEGLARLEEGDIDVLIVDYSMPVYGGIDVIRSISGNPANPPIIMLTGNGNERVAVEALKAGASDYLVKDVGMGFLELLPVVIQQVISNSMVMRERERMFHTLREQEERYRKLVELFPDGVAILKGGKISFVNRAGLSLLKSPSLTEVIGRLFSDFIDPDHRSVFDSQLAVMEEGGGQVPWMEQTLLPLMGERVPVEIAGIPFQHEGGHLCQVIFRDITERKLARERLEQMAHYDLLTGLPNRSFFFEHLVRMLDQAGRYRDLMAVLYLDLDHFKPVNDELGHEGGDILLKQVSDRLLERVRKSDLIARIGGDEFVILLSKIRAPSDAELVASKILESVARPFDIGGNRRSIGVSIGISLFPRDGHDGSLLVKKADMAMYRAKSSGKNRYVLFSEG